MVKANDDLPAMPTPEEAKWMLPIIKDALAHEGVVPSILGEHPKGGIMAAAEMTEAQKHDITAALFEKGIVLAEVRPGEFGFAIRR